MPIISMNVSAIVDLSVTIVVDITPTELVAGLEHGIYFASIGSVNPEIIDINGVLVARINKVENNDPESLYSDFSLVESY